MEFLPLLAAAILATTATSLLSLLTASPPSIDIDAMDVVVLGVTTAIAMVCHGGVLWLISWFGWDAD